uniref:Uncharacterized protein n=1 Tax=Kalanchoe fedtschenkoi TaxID=63787 RepID=A0A7N0VKH4_KALFE
MYHLRSVPHPRHQAGFLLVMSLHLSSFKLPYCFHGSWLASVSTGVLFKIWVWPLASILEPEPFGYWFDCV